MSVQNDLIDQDHRYLICLFNCLELALDRDDYLTLLPDFFQQLLDYTKSHFTREERIQLKMNYAKYMEHKQDHQSIIAEIEEINQKIQKCVNSSDPNIDFPVNADVLLLARKWVIDHILKADRDMIPLLKTLPRNFQG
ncbi:MAG: hemerythrin family protein [Gammaproteobacteria bacterium]|nr:hemerythrin family protein [Gammaproteobacteria bacterium]